jgi:septum formation inhibitor MinC
MSAVPTVPATPTPVPAEQVNVNMPKEQIAAAVPTPTPATPAIPVAPAEPTPENPVVTKDLGGGQFEVKYLTGETFKGTAAEILPKMGGAHVSTKLWAKTEIEKAKQPPAPPEPPTPQLFANEEESKIAKYVTELQAKELGFQSVDDYKAALGRIQQNTEQFAGQNLSVMFSAAAPEFNATKENSEKLLNTVETLGLLPLMTSGDTTQQLNALRAAHAFALQTKVYEAKPAAQAAPTPPIPPPPIPSTGPVDLTTIPEDVRVDVNMSKDEIQRRIDLARSRQIIY